MAKFKVVKEFRDVHTKEVYAAGAEIQLTVKRSEEIAKNLDETFLERLEENKDTRKIAKK